MSKKASVILHLQAYAQLMEYYYANTWNELFLNENEPCLYKDAVETSIQDFASERFGCLMVIGRAIEIVENFIETTEHSDETFEDKNPQNIAIGLLKKLVSDYTDSLIEPDAVSYLEQQARQELGFIREVTLHSGRETGSNLIKERVNDFLEAVPLSEVIIQEKALMTDSQPAMKQYLN